VSVHDQWREPSATAYAAVGMASFIAAAYKTPLAAVVFVAEATGGTPLSFRPS
jgi:H+/Cl- antiporter ClcA